MDIERAKRIQERRFDGVRAGEFTKEQLLAAMKFIREWKYDNDPKYRAMMDRAKLLGKSLTKN